MHFILVPSPDICTIHPLIFAFTFKLPIFKRAGIWRTRGKRIPLRHSWCHFPNSSYALHRLVEIHFLPFTCCPIYNILLHTTTSANWFSTLTSKATFSLLLRNFFYRWLLFLVSHITNISSYILSLWLFVVVVTLIATTVLQSRPGFHAMMMLSRCSCCERSRSDGTTLYFYNFIMSLLTNNNKNKFISLVYKRRNSSTRWVAW